MKKWKEPVIWKLGMEYTEAGYPGGPSDGVFIDNKQHQGPQTDQQMGHLGHS